MGRIKYIIHPGTIVSRLDGDIHYIGFSQLVKLYNVNPDECISAERLENLFGLDLDGCIHLFPETNGDYKLKEELK